MCEQIVSAGEITAAQSAPELARKVHAVMVSTVGHDFAAKLTPA
jgi:hypothetical protein